MSASFSKIFSGAVNFPGAACGANRQFSLYGWLCGSARIVFARGDGGQLVSGTVDGPDEIQRPQVGRMLC